MLTSGQLLKLGMIPIAIQSRSNRAPTAPTANPHRTQCPPTTERCTYTAKPTTPTRIVASNCPLFPHILCSDFIPNEQLHLAWPAATIPTTCTPGHAPPPHPQASAATCNLHPAGSFASQQPPKRASPQKARPSHALSSLQPSRPITHLASELQSVRASSTTFIPATFTLPQTRAWEESIPHRHPIATWYISLPIRCIIASKLSVFSATPPRPPILTSFAMSNFALPDSWLS